MPLPVVDFVCDAGRMSDKSGEGWVGVSVDANNAGASASRQSPLCSFCGLSDRPGVAGPTPAVDISFDCIDRAAEVKAQVMRGGGLDADQSRGIS